MPAAPAGEALCDDDRDGIYEACLSDRQLGQLLDDAADRICEANDRIAWLSDYFLGTKLGPSCSQY